MRQFCNLCLTQGGTEGRIDILRENEPSKETSVHCYIYGLDSDKLNATMDKLQCWGYYDK
jgi:hypothetical protein